ncbi:MAG: cyclic pyranopterin monophosphate synthase MoaC, partial [Phycisphaerae bacterium]|nr:cyclic pyranopterin monophosphate synthase MoaC [Phycisphaerae bacterium]
TSRLARAQAVVRLGSVIAGQLADTPITAKGNVLQVARLAGIQAAKRTAELIPLCHPLPLERIDLEAELAGDCVRIRATVAARARTGLEMEALTAVSVAALSVYDMCKALGKDIEITDICLLEKSGGKSGPYQRK